MSFENLASQAQTETLTDLIRVRGLWFYLVRHWFLLNRVRMGHVATEFLPDRLCVVRINLGVIASCKAYPVVQDALRSHVLRAIRWTWKSLLEGGINFAVRRLVAE